MKFKVGYVTLTACLGGSFDAGSKGESGHLWLYQNHQEIEREWVDTFSEQCEQHKEGEREFEEIDSFPPDDVIRQGHQIESGVTFILDDSASYYEYIHNPAEDVDILCKVRRVGIKNGAWHLEDCWGNRFHLLTLIPIEPPTTKDEEQTLLDGLEALDEAIIARTYSQFREDQEEAGKLKKLKTDLLTYLEMARVCLSVYPEIQEEMDIADDEFIRLRDNLTNFLTSKKHEI